MYLLITLTTPITFPTLIALTIVLFLVSNCIIKQTLRHTHNTQNTLNTFNTHITRNADIGTPLITLTTTITLTTVITLPMPGSFFCIKLYSKTDPSQHSQHS